MSSTTPLNDTTSFVGTLDNLPANNTAGTTGPSTAPTPIQMQSAHDFLSAYLDQFGLGNLADFAWKQWQAGTPANEILLSIRGTPEYQARFPGMASLQKAGIAITEGQYISQESTYQQMMRAYGIPPESGFYSHDYLGKFIEGQVSPAELQTRLDEAKQASTIDAYSQAAKDLYGISGGTLLTHFLDPTVGTKLLTQQFNAIEAGGEASRAGFGNLSQPEAEYLAQFGLTQGQLNQGFSAEANPSLSAPLPGEGNQGVDRQSELEAISGNALAQQRIKQRQEQLVSATQGSAQFSSGKEGSGVGEAQQPF